MCVLSDKSIRARCLDDQGNYLPNPMIYPYSDKQVKVNTQGAGALSWGTSSYGYDIRLGYEFKVFTNVNNTVVDPKHFDESSFVNLEGDVCTIPPNSFMLAATLEKFAIPRDILAMCVGKSSYARCGLIVNVTPLEPEWEGYLTLEISNTTPLPARIYSGEGVAQLLFFLADQPCEVSYADRKGKYQGQTELTLPRM